VAAHLRAEFLALWERADSAVPHAGLSALMDDDGGPVVRNLPPAYALGVARDAAVLLEGLADAIASDQRHLDGVSRTADGRGPDVARLVACKRGHRLLATRALPPLTEPGGDAASDRARTRTRYVMMLRLQALDALIAREPLGAAASGGSTLRPAAPSGAREPPGIWPRRGPAR